MKNFLITIIIIVILASIGVVSFSAYNYIQEKNSLKFDLIPPQNNSTSTDSVNLDGNATSSLEFATSTVDMTSWKMYENAELGFGIKYPRELVMNNDDTSLILAFPKKNYFHWPLEDDVKITVIASSTCAGPVMLADYGNTATSTLVINYSTNSRHLNFAKSETNDVALGNVYKKVSYDIKGNGVCYSIVFESHGANGAGLYVDDPVLVKKYDDQHVVDVNNLMNVVYSILGSFQLRDIL